MSGESLGIIEAVRVIDRDAINAKRRERYKLARQKEIDERAAGFKEQIALAGRSDEPIVCGRCRGKGRIRKSCSKCGGYGYLNPLI